MNRVRQAVWAGALAATAVIQVGNAAAQLVYFPDARTKVTEVGAITELDGAGVLRSHHQVEIRRPMCGGNVRFADGVEARVGEVVDPIDPELFADNPPDPNPVQLIVQRPGAGGRAVGPTIHYDISGTIPSGATAALTRASERYCELFDDVIDIHVDIEFEVLSDATVIGSTKQKTKKYKYDEVRPNLVADADGDDTVLSYMPTGTRIDVVYEDSTVTNEKHVYLARAAAKAIGLIKADSTRSDGELKFNTDFSFDYDPTDGVASSRMDFELVLTHELGHLFGFSSGVDDRNKNIENIDLFRFKSADCPATYTDFRNTARTGGEDKQGVNCYTCLPGWGDWRMATGEISGDGDQASHWKDDNATGIWVGMMDPTLGSGDNFYDRIGTAQNYFTLADMRTFDALGYDFLLSSLYPGMPTLTAPADGSSGITLTPTLQWSPAADTTRYRVVILTGSSSGTGFTTVVNTTTTATSYSVPIGTLGLNTTYIWYILAENAWGDTTSDLWFFTTDNDVLINMPAPFNLQDPPDFALNVDLTPGFTWELNTNGVASYVFELTDQPDFIGPPIYSEYVYSPFVPIIPGPIVQIPPYVLANNTVYRWRVLAYNSAGQQISGDLPDGWSFTTGNFPPHPFGQLGPRHGMTELSPTLTLEWQPAYQAEVYSLIVDDDPAFGSPEINTTGLTEATFAVAAGRLANATTYHWQVTAHNAFGATVSDPMPHVFTTVELEPAPFALLAPVDQTIVIPTTPRLSWTPAAGANGYLVEVDDDPDFGTPDALAFVGSNGLWWDVPPGTLLRGTVYHWQVNAVNAGGYTAATPVSAQSFLVAAGDADADQDGDRDLADFAAFQRCFSDIGGGVAPGCAPFDLDGDLDIDLVDLDPLVVSLTGP